MAECRHMNMETPNNFENQIGNLSSEGINIESVLKLIDEIESKIESGEDVTPDDGERINEKIETLREAQEEVDDQDIRSAIVRLTTLKETLT